MNKGLLSFFSNPSLIYLHAIGMKKVTPGILFIFLFHGFTFSQKSISFYVSPYIGGEWTLSTFENKKEKPPYITGTTLDLSDKYGLNLLADFNNKFSLEVGYGWGNVGWGLNYKSQTDSALNSASGGSSSSTTVRRTSIKFSKPISTVKIRRNKEKDFIGKQLNLPSKYQYLAVFDVQLFAGFSHEYIPPFVGGVLEIVRGGWGRDNIALNNDVCEDDDYCKRENPYGFGAFAGFSLQFYQLGKRRFELGFLYHKGLNKRIVANWETSINGVEFPSFQTFTRGSMISMYLAYPIKLFEINKNKSP